MRFTLHLFGAEVFSFYLGPDPAPDDDPQRDLSGGTTTSTPIGFTASYPDQRWGSTPQFEEYE